MKYKPEIERTIDRYRRLWRFQEIDPPLVMIDLPGSAVSAGGHDCEFWDSPDAFVERHLDSLSMRRLIPDDTIPMLRPPWSHAALPAALGAEPELHGGKLWVRPILDDWADYRGISLDGDSRWLGRIERYYERLLDLSEGRFAIGLCEVPGPADLMGALRGFESVLLDLYDAPDMVRAFALDAAEAAVAFHERLRELVARQECYGGCLVANSWAPEDTVYFCEHTSVNYSPALYERFLKPANSSLLAGYGHAVTYVYCVAGSHHIADYFDRDCPVWLRSCDGDPSPDMVERFRGPSPRRSGYGRAGGRAIVTIHAAASEFHSAYSRYGGLGVCYQVSCASLDEAKGLCRSLGL